MSDRSIAQYLLEWLSKYAEPWARWKDNRARGGRRFFDVLYIGLMGSVTSFALLWVTLKHVDLGLLIIVALLAPTIGIGAAVLASAKFCQVVFGIKGYRDALAQAWLFMHGVFLAEPPHAFVKEGALEPKSEEERWRTIGGPGILVVDQYSAVVLETLLEHRGPAWRAVLPSVAFVERFERIESIIDLRPQARLVHARKLTTMDGIPIDIDVTVSFQIEMKGEPNPKTPYPASPKAVLKAARAEARIKAKTLKLDKDFFWHDRINGAIDSTLKSIVSQYRLDELIGLGSNRYPLQTILYKQMYQKMSAVTEQYGAVILDIKFGDIKMPDEVSKQRIDSWRSVWESRAEFAQARSKAEYYRQVERARALAQQEMIMSLTTSLASANASGNGTGRLIALRFIEWMGRISTDTNMNVYLPQEALNALMRLKDVMDQPMSASASSLHDDGVGRADESSFSPRGPLPSGDNDATRSFSADDDSTAKSPAA